MSLSLTLFPFCCGSMQFRCIRAKICSCGLTTPTNIISCGFYSRLAFISLKHGICESFVGERCLFEEMRYLLYSSKPEVRVGDQWPDRSIFPATPYLLIICCTLCLQLSALQLPYRIACRAYNTLTTPSYVICAHASHHFLIPS